MSYGLNYIELRCVSGARNAFYKMALITKPGGGATLIKQWGRIGAKGQVKVEHGGIDLMRRERNDMLDAKKKKEYHSANSINLSDVGDPNDIANKLVELGFSSVGFFDSELSGPPDYSMESKTPKRAPEPETPVVRPAGWGEW